MIVIVTLLAVCFSGCTEKQSNEAAKSEEDKEKSPDLPSQYILLNRSAESMDSIGRYTESTSGKTFLVIDMDLENHGYKSFDINPNYFAVVIDKVAYPYDSATFSTATPLTSMALLDGGKASGTLVFQIPKDKTQYTIVYVGQGDYNFIYGDLPTAKDAQVESKPKVPSRNLTYSIKGIPYRLTGESYYTRVDTSNPGYVIQTTKSERIDNPSERAPFVLSIIKTFLDESLKPTNTDKAIQDATNSYRESIDKLSSGATIDENPAYESTLANGDTVSVRQFKKVPSVYNGQVRVFSYMPDGNTIATVASSENKQEFDEIIRTLNIGELQGVQ